MDFSEQQPGDKRVTNTPEITPGDGETTPDENLDLLIVDINIPSVGDLHNQDDTRKGDWNPWCWMTLFLSRSKGTLAGVQDDDVPYSGKTLIVVNYSPPLPNVS